MLDLSFQDPGNGRTTAVPAPSPRSRAQSVFPFPLAHGGAVRIFNLLREMSGEFDIFLFAFQRHGNTDDLKLVRDLCARVILVDKPRYREPRWSTFAPPEVHDSSCLRWPRRWLASAPNIESRPCKWNTPCSRRMVGRAGGARRHFCVVPADSRPYARYPPTLGPVALAAIREEMDRALSQGGCHVGARSRAARSPQRYVVPNGVDLARFTPESSALASDCCLSDHSVTSQISLRSDSLSNRFWPFLCQYSPSITLTVVAGPDPLLYWRDHTDSPPSLKTIRIHLLEFVSDVRPLYVEANLAIVPTLIRPAPISKSWKHGDGSRGRL